jgi:serine/threonine protein kinase
MALAEIIALIRDVADILEHAHCRGIIHRNVSPGAIIVPAQPRRFSVSLVDWSGARTHDSTSPVPPFPRDSARAFLPPEQLAGQATDGRGDVYSLGVIARELVTGASLGAAPPVLISLIQSMVDHDPANRPSSERVRDTAAWLATQIDGVPSPIDDNSTEPTAITSEHSPSVAGTIDRR